MAYLTDGQGDGHLYIGHVKWSNDYKHTMLFTTVSNNKFTLSRTARNTFMTTNLSSVSEKVVYINPNKYVDVAGKIKGLDNKNYLFFYNDSDIGGTSSERVEYCCFIKDYEYIAPNNTRLYIELDVIQTYFYDCSFYRSFIERGHVSSDSMGAWLAPEPISVVPSYMREINQIKTNADWLPSWVLHSTSKYNTTTLKYTYGGTDTSLGEYGTYVNSASAIRDFIKNYGKKSVQEIAEDAQSASGNETWIDWINSIFAGTAGTDIIDSVKATTSASDLQDHRDEIIGVYAIPTWAKASGEPSNTPTVKTVTCSLNSTLACGYNPRNNKMLTSLCKAYMIYDENGTKIPYKPELFTGTPTASLSCAPMSVNGYYLNLSNYRDYTEATKQIPYNCERRVSYDVNTGLNKSMNILSSGVNMLTSAIPLVTAPTNPVAVINGAEGIANSTMNMVDALGQRGATIGSNGDIMSITNNHPALHWCDVSPNYAECEYIDDFLDTFGYAINELYAPRSWMYTRTYWNYIKTQDVNINAQCPANYEQKIKDILNAGITFWHDYSKYGRYDLSNSMTGYTPA